MTIKAEAISKAHQAACMLWSDLREAAKHASETEQIMLRFLIEDAARLEIRLSELNQTVQEDSK